MASGVTEFSEPDVGLEYLIYIEYRGLGGAISVEHALTVIIQPAAEDGALGFGFSFLLSFCYFCAF